MRGSGFLAAQNKRWLAAAAASCGWGGWEGRATRWELVGSGVKPLLYL